MNIENSLPFSVKINVRTLPRSGRHEEFRADTATCDSIARENGLIEVERFTGTADVRRWKRDGICVEGQVIADVVQPCAVSAEPINASIHETFRAIFLPEDSRLSRPATNEDGELVIDADGPDVPATFTGDSIDLAEVWLEFFVLGLDPFLRLDGVELTDLADDSGDVGESSAFAVLKSLKKH